MIRKITEIFKGMRVIAIFSVFMLTSALAGQVDINNVTHSWYKIGSTSVFSTIK